MIKGEKEMDNYQYYTSLISFRTAVVKRFSQDECLAIIKKAFSILNKENSCPIFQEYQNKLITPIIIINKALKLNNKNYFRQKATCLNVLEFKGEYFSLSQKQKFEIIKLFKLNSNASSLSLATPKAVILFCLSTRGNIITKEICNQFYISLSNKENNISKGTSSENDVLLNVFQKVS